jgi:hypothetical protein
MSSGPKTPSMMQCALCRTKIAPSSAKRVVDGESYHLGCWDRKVRLAQETKAKRPSGRGAGGA